MLRIAVIAACLAAAPAAALTPLEFVNAVRAARGVAPVAESPKLTAAAMAHARDMERRGYYSHYSRDGSKPSMRAKRKGYRYCFMTENIAMGERTLGQILKLWQQSPDHYKNMTHRKARDFGLGYSGQYWVMMLGSENC